jgi:hypothetical protein
VEDSKPVDLYTYAPEQIPQIWPHVKDYIESSLIENGHITLESIRDNLLLNNYLLWTPITMDVQGAIVTSIVTDVNQKMHCVLLSCGGKNMNDWKDYTFNEITKWAQDEGCKFMKIYGRKGWARLLGFEIVSYEMRKEI